MKSASILIGVAVICLSVWLIKIEGGETDRSVTETPSAEYAAIETQGVIETAEAGEAVKTPEPTPMVVTRVNPYKGRIWNQYCRLIREGGKIVDADCTEEWARKPLPGGCADEVMNFMGNSACTAAAVGYVVNTMLTPEEIAEYTGGEGDGVTPDWIIEQVYPNLPDRVLLSCRGTSVPTLRQTLEYFGLETRSRGVSKGSLKKEILPGEMAVVGVTFRYEGEWLEHWTVLDHIEGNKLYFADSFLGRGSVVDFDTVPTVSSWEITSILFVSKPSP